MTDIINYDLINEILTKIDFDKKEISIYLSSLELGEAPASTIAKKANIQRELTYVVLKRLEQKGVASHTTKDYKKYYCVVNPEELVKQLEEKIYLLKKVIPDLNEIKQKISVKKPSSKSFQGVEGIKSILNLILNYYEKNPNEKEILGFGPSGYFEELLKYSLPHFINRRKELKVNFKAVYDESKKAIEKKKLPYSEIRFSNQVDSPSFTLIFPNHVVTIMFNEEPLALLVESKEIYQSYLKHFDVLWKNSKK